MDIERLVRFVFVLYCATVGAVLVLVPWSPGWERMIAHLPAGFEILRQPLLRGALSGFGLVHLVWCVHDLILLVGTEVSSRGPGAPRSPGSSSPASEPQKPNRV
ncbi:MAG: hypothetical protein AAF560_09130 [Acidobacteriota bacterium]